MGRIYFENKLRTDENNIITNEAPIIAHHFCSIAEVNNPNILYENYPKYEKFIKDTVKNFKENKEDIPTYFFTEKILPYKNKNSDNQFILSFIAETISGYNFDLFINKIMLISNDLGYAITVEMDISHFGSFDRHCLKSAISDFNKYYHKQVNNDIRFVFWTDKEENFI